MPGKQTSKKIAIVSGIVFIVFASVMAVIRWIAQAGMNVPEISSRIGALIVLVFYLPLESALFFFARVCSFKHGRWQDIYRVLTFVSIGLFSVCVVVFGLSASGVIR